MTNKNYARKMIAIALSAAMIFSGSAVISSVSGIDAAAATVSTVALTNTSSISSTSITQGKSVNLMASAKGGSGSYTYAFYYKKAADTSWKTIKGFSTTSYTSFQPPEATDYNICIKVKDSANKVENKYFDLKVNAAMSLSVTLSSNSVIKGQTVSVMASANGSSGPYTYAYYYKKTTDKNWVTVKGFSQTTYLSIKPSMVASYEICVKVKDASGNVVKKYLEFESTAPVTSNSSISSDNITLGESIKLNAAYTGGSGNCTYAFYTKPTSSNGWHTESAFSTTSAVDFTPDKTGTYDICIKIKDSSGMQVKQYFTLTVKSAVLPLKATYAISNNQIILGESVILSASAEGGTGDYTYAFYTRTSGTNSWHTKSPFSTVSSVEYTPSKAGTYDICIKAKDSSGKEVKEYFVVTVESNILPLVSHSYISSDMITLGESVKLQAAAEGGTEDYTYAFYAKSADSDTWRTLRGFSTNALAEYTPVSEGTYDICIKIKDSNGTLAKEYFTLTVNQVILPLINQSKINTDSITLGESVNLQAFAEGGTGDYAYAFYAKSSDAESWEQLTDFTSDNSFGYTPDQIGTYNLCIVVKDSSGQEEESYFTLTVEQPAVPPIVNTSTINTDTITLGENMTLTGSAEGGTGDFTYAFYAKSSRSSNWQTLSDFGRNTTIQCSFPNIGTYDIRITAKDSSGETSDIDFVVTVQNPATDPVVNTSYISEDDIMLGESITIVAQAEGGSNKFRYTITISDADGTEESISSSSEDSFTYTPDHKGTYNICIIATDSYGEEAEIHFTLTVETEQPTEFESEINVVLYEIIDDNDSEFDKVKAIHDWIAEHVEYDQRLFTVGVPDESYTAEGAFEYGVAVCDGYAKLFRQMATQAGLEAERVTGLADNGSGPDNHAWNQVKVDGEWYNIDVTWDDPIIDGVTDNSNIRYDYFMVPDSVLEQDHAPDNKPHDCTAEQPQDFIITIELERATQDENCAYAENARKLKNIMQDFADRGIDNFTVIYHGTTDKVQDAVSYALPAGHGVSYGYMTWKFDGYSIIYIQLT